MRTAAFLFALLLPAVALAAESAKPPMVQNAVTPQNGYVFQPNPGPEGGGRWTRATPHPAATIDTQQQYPDPAEVTQAPPADINADTPEVSAPAYSNPAAAAERDPNPPIASTGGGSWSLPQAELDAMAGRSPQGEAPKANTVPQQAQNTAPQQQAQPVMQMQSMTVTSVEKCLSQLPPAEAAEVRARYVKPYEECQNRVAGKAREQKAVEAGKQAEALAPETPRNYVRVAVPKTESPAPAPDTNTATSGGSEKSYIDISGSAKARLNP